jgi:hypothetical protein
LPGTLAGRWAASSAAAFAACAWVVISLSFVAISAEFVRLTLEFACCVSASRRSLVVVKCMRAKAGAGATSATPSANPTSDSINRFTTVSLLGQWS